MYTQTRAPSLVKVSKASISLFDIKEWTDPAGYNFIAFPDPDLPKNTGIMARDAVPIAHQFPRTDSHVSFIYMD